MPIDIQAARTFILANARVLERHVHAAQFDGRSAAPVVAALAAYQNPDGGFAHGLEPDTRSPHSQPLDVEAAFERLAAVGARPSEMTDRACDFLATVGPDGGVPLLLPSIDGWPMATHWVDRGDMPPALNPTAGIAGLAHAIGVEHPWLDAATEWCFARLEVGDLPDDAHSYIRIARLLEHAPDRVRADRLAPVVAAAAPASAMFQLDPDPDNYGVTPLHVAPTPGHIARAWFDDAVIDAHLDALAADQQSDGGWPVHWRPPGGAGVWEWRAIVTLDALVTLRASDRL